MLLLTTRDLELANGLGPHHASADTAASMEAREAAGRLRVRIAKQRQRDPVIDAERAGEVAEQKRERARADVRQVHSLDDRTAEEGFRLSDCDGRLPEVLFLPSLSLRSAAMVLPFAMNTPRWR